MLTKLLPQARFSQWRNLSCPSRCSSLSLGFNSAAYHHHHHHVRVASRCFSSFTDRSAAAASPLNTAGSFAVDAAPVLECDRNTDPTSNPSTSTNSNTNSSMLISRPGCMAMEVNSLWNTSRPSSIAPHICACLNAQANQEMLNSQIYLAAAYWFEARGFRGIAHMLRSESDEERKHAAGIWDHVSLRGGEVVVDSLKRPAQDWKGPLAVFHDLVASEAENLVRLQDVMRQARESSDFSTETLLVTYIKQQVTDLDEIRYFADRIEASKLIPGLIFSLDAQMATSK